MPRGYCDSEDNEGQLSNDDECTDTDDSSIFEDDESEYMYNLANDPLSFEDVKIRPVVFKKLKLGEAVIEVSSQGRIKEETSIFSSSEGFVYPGTPFRTYTVQWDKHDFRTFFVHELVWHAFQGHPPDGWEVRHKPEHTKYPRKTYSNALHHLTITPCVVSKLPKT
jgi:hypothetical protein